MGLASFFLRVVPMSCSLIVLLLSAGSGAVAQLPPSDPTHGFTPLHLDSSNLVVQHPYDLPVGDRYAVADGVHTLWVLASDKPHSQTSKTAPRTEIRIQGYDYSSGVWQFEGHAQVPSGTSGVCIMQVFGAAGKATTLMLTVFNGTLMYYRSQLVADNIYGRWFQINVIHNVEEKTVQVFVDGILKLTAADRGGAYHYFKFGVYAQSTSSYCMESRWKGIKIFKK